MRIGSDTSALRVGVIGLGRVGESVCELFAPHGDVVAWDQKSSAPYPDGQDVQAIVSAATDHGYGAALLASNARFTAALDVVDSRLIDG